MFGARLAYRITFIIICLILTIGLGLGFLGAAALARDELQAVALNPAKDYQTEIVAVPAKYRKGVFRGQRQLQVLRGLQVSVFASGLSQPRFMALSPTGDIYLSVPSAGRVLVLPDRNNDGVADRVVIFADGLDRPHGLVFRGRELVVAENGRLTRLLDTNSDLRADTRTTLSNDMPSGGGHATRTVVQGPDGKLYVAAGSSCNACIESDPRRAAVMRFPAQGGKGEIYARGLRNTVGLVFHPVTGELWGVDNGRDMLGDDEPPEELNRIEAGADYGWPYCFGAAVPDPEFGTEQRCGQTRPPVVAMQAHSAPLGLTFGQGLAFPERYQQALLVAFHGSWNRSKPTGYKLIGIPFADGEPQGKSFDIISGWLDEGEAWGRPVDPLVGADGALYLSDDSAGAVYRITWKGPLPKP